MGALLAAMLAVTMTVAQTQPSGEKRSFSLQEAQQYAAEHNRSMKKATLALEQAEKAKWATYANYLPQASASINYQTNMTSDSLSLGMMKIAMKPSSSLTIQVSQPIINYSILVGMRLSEIARDMTKNAIEQTELAIKQNVNSVYYSILVLEHSKTILAKNIENLRTLAKATRIKVNVGIGESTEADQMDITLANLENTLQNTNQNIEVAYNSLRLLLGMGTEGEVVLTSKLAELTNEQKILSLMAQPFELGKNIDKKTSDLNLKLSEGQVKSAQGAIYPTVTAVYQRNEKIIKPLLDFSMKNTLMFTANVPLFAGGKNDANIKKAKLALQSAQLDNDQLKDQLLLQEKQLKYNLKSALESYALQQKNIELSQRVFNNITKKYEQGVSSSLEVTNANNNLLTAQSNYVSAVMNLLNAQDALLKLLGTI